VEENTHKRAPKPSSKNPDEDDEEKDEEEFDKEDAENKGEDEGMKEGEDAIEHEDTNGFFGQLESRDDTKVEKSDEDDDTKGEKPDGDDALEKDEPVHEADEGDDEAKTIHKEDVTKEREGEDGDD
jgi:hypothetical protein